MVGTSGFSASQCLRSAFHRAEALSPAVLHARILQHLTPCLDSYKLLLRVVHSEVYVNGFLGVNSPGEVCGCAVVRACLSGLLGSLLLSGDSPVLLYEPALGMFSKPNNIGLWGSARLCLHSLLLACASSVFLRQAPLCGLLSLPVSRCRRFSRVGT